MRAVVYDAPRRFTVTEIPTPVAGPGEVRVKVIQTGVCGTDLHLHEGQFMAVYPLIPGHETVGLVDQLGDGVTSVALGQQVTVNPNASCGHCDYCRSGRPILCDELTGMGSSRPGAFADYVVASAAQVFDVEGLPIDTAVFVEPTSCAAHGLDVIRPRHGSDALVIGAGPTGLLMAQLIKHGGAARVTVAGPTAFKLRTAEALGVDATYVMDRADLAGDVRRLRTLAGGHGFDLVVDATGRREVIEQCVPLTRNGGTAVFYGVAEADDLVAISPYDVFRREITIKGSFAEINSFPSAIAALRNGRARTDGLITHRFALEDYGQALDAVRSDTSAHKVVIVP